MKNTERVLLIVFGCLVVLLSLVLVYRSPQLTFWELLNQAFQSGHFLQFWTHPLGNIFGFEVMTAFLSMGAALVLNSLSVIFAVYYYKNRFVEWGKVLFLLPFLYFGSLFNPWTFIFALLIISECLFARYLQLYPQRFS